LSAALALAGCVSSSPKTGQGSVFKSRAMAQEKGGVRASVVALSAAESEAVYGVPLAGKGMQPVWIEIDNRDDRAYWLMYPGLDPNFFPVSEAVEAFEQDRSGAGAAELARRFRALTFRNPVAPGTTKSGFVLTNLDEGVKLVQLDLLATGQLRAFSFLTVVPGFRADYQAREVFSREIYPPEEIVDYTEDDTFRAALETLPCCVTNESGSKNGDPLNHRSATCICTAARRIWPCRKRATTFTNATICVCGSVPCATRASTCGSGRSAATSAAASRSTPPP
jgi:hypothetical protein